MRIVFEGLRAIPGRRTGLALVCGLLIVIAQGCAGAIQRSTGHLVRSSRLDSVLDAGFAVAPFAQKSPDVAGRKVENVLRDMTSEFYLSLEVSLTLTPLVSPESLEALVGAQGERARERLRWVRRIAMRGEVPDRESLVELSKIVQHRYLLLAWVDEGHKSGSDSSETLQYGLGAAETFRTDFVDVVGRIEGVVLDLWEHELLWRGAVAYESPRIYGNLQAMEDEIQRSRLSAAQRFATLCGEF